MRGDSAFGRGRPAPAISTGGAGAGIVVDVGHAGMGQGLIPTMRSVAGEAGCPVAHSQHLVSDRR